LKYALNGKQGKDLFVYCLPYNGRFSCKGLLSQIENTPLKNHTFTSFIDFRLSMEEPGFRALATSLLNIIGVWHGVSKGVEDGCRSPALWAGHL
jgi:hypothetical protein